MPEDGILPKEGFVRLSQFLGRGRVLPIGRSTWWAGVKSRHDLAKVAAVLGSRVGMTRNLERIVRRLEDPLKAKKTSRSASLRSGVSL